MKGGETLKIGCCRPGTGKFHVGGSFGESGCAHYFLLPLWLLFVVLVSGERGSLLGAGHAHLRPVRILTRTLQRIWRLLAFVCGGCLEAASGWKKLLLGDFGVMFLPLHAHLSSCLQAVWNVGTGAHH